MSLKKNNNHICIIVHSSVHSLRMGVIHLKWIQQLTQTKTDLIEQYQCITCNLRKTWQQYMAKPGTQVLFVLTSLPFT